MKQLLAISITFFVAVFSCVPYQQQSANHVDVDIASAYKGLVVNNSELFDNRTAIEGTYANPRYNSILHASLTKPMRVHKDFLLLSVRHAGGTDLSYHLIWDGSYRVDSRGKYHVNLIYDCQINYVNRALYHNDLGFDLTTLRTPNTNEIILHFFGGQRYSGIVIKRPVKVNSTCHNHRLLIEWLRRRFTPPVVPMITYSPASI